ncbi:MAG: penicillin-binding transpeptidase domain-containing protein [Ruminococcus flavefaciens]|nr:penicillin-binding transpeptidase domain-containing protein [Ruminococcus flavefaciens]
MALVVLAVVWSSMRLMKLQVVGGDTIEETQESDDTLVYQKEVKATRGEIVDFNGNLLVTNDKHCDIVLQKAFFPENLSEGNEVLINVYMALLGHSYKFKESLPITMTEPYEFTEEDVSEVREKLHLNVYASAENCIDKLISDYEISDSYTAREKRIIAGMRYDMIDKEFSYSNDLVLAEDVTPQTVTEMKELGNLYHGIEAVDISERRIERGDILPHEIGTVGPIYAEEYDELRAKGYKLNDTLGKSGIESAMETELRGQNGIEEISVKDGAVSSVKTISETNSGSTVKLTVDGAYQLKLQGILDNFLDNFQSINTNWHLTNVHKGAIVVLDAKTGAVKGMATAPTYNLKDYAVNYEDLLNDEDSPLLNRCTYGLYRPGSTFKTVTATAGLNEGIVDAGTSLYCGHWYNFHGSTFSCTGTHGYLSTRRAIQVSCNCYFYELSSRLGIDNITKYSQLYGLGSHTGIETGDSAGYLCNPETFAERGQPWYVGFVIQAGIGNYDCGMTPLQMAVVANTIANRGVRYKPYLVDSLYKYGTDELIYQTQPTVAEKIELSNDYLYDPIINGMIDASHNVPVYRYSLSNLGFDVAIKTGTPQTDQNDLSKQNSFFIGFAPADDPEIAFAGVIEGGEYSKYMIRDIILEYQKCYGLNGVEPSAVLPDENGELPETTTTTTGTATGTTTIGTGTATSTGTGSSSSWTSSSYTTTTSSQTVTTVTSR